jgi:GT2 family glycosyltransferase
MNGRHVMDGGQEVAFQRSGDEDRLVVPVHPNEKERLAECLRQLKSEVVRLDYALEDHGVSSASLRVSARGADLDELWTRLFARVHRYPYFGGIEGGSFRNAANPVLSCVVLLTGNDRFVQRHLIPSILANSVGYPLEIIVVYDGEGLDLDPFRNLRIVRSDFGWVSRAYNTGVRAARGRYVALFHDDCLVSSPSWIGTSVRMLDAGHVAVTPEIQRKPKAWGGELDIAKNVPLIMRRRDFVASGGYDEFYFAGYEDQDFTYTLLSEGGRIGRLDLPYFHFNGMSTVVLASGAAELFRVLFGYNALGRDVIYALREESLRRLRAHPKIGLAEARDTLYFVRKHHAYFVERRNAGVLEMGQSMDKYLAARLVEYLFDPVLQDRQRFGGFYRSLLGLPGEQAG